MLETSKTATKKEIPLLKEHHAEKIVQALDCIKKFPYDRQQQKGCVLSLYNGKSEKSVFRGMVIPTLRKTGLILGYAGLIRISANGSLLVESKKISEIMHKRTLCAVFLDIDRQKFGFIDKMLSIMSYKESVSRDKLKSAIYRDNSAASVKQSMERINSWLNILESAELLKITYSEISLNYELYNQAVSDLEINEVKGNRFFQIMVASFKELHQSSVIVDIADLRDKCVVKMLYTLNEIVTESQFDNMLSKNIDNQSDYIISLGRPMGAEEKLFPFNGKCYRTITIEAVDHK